MANNGARKAKSFGDWDRDRSGHGWLNLMDKNTGNLVELILYGSSSVKLILDTFCGRALD